MTIILKYTERPTSKFVLNRLILRLSLVFVELNKLFLCFSKPFKRPQKLFWPIQFNNNSNPKKIKLSLAFFLHVQTLSSIRAIDDRTPVAPCANVTTTFVGWIRLETGSVCFGFFFFHALICYSVKRKRIHKTIVFCHRNKKEKKNCDRRSVARRYYWHKQTICKTCYYFFFFVT